MGLEPGRGFRLGPVALGERPVVAAVCSDREIRSGGAGLPGRAEVLELRVDRFAEKGPEHVSRVVEEASRTGRGVLVTVRAEVEGGECFLDDAARLELYRAAAAAHALDAEIRSEGLWATLGRLGGGDGRLLIASFHDFASTPPRAVLEELWIQGKDRGADVVKIACRLSGIEDLRRLAAFTLDHASEGVITLGMGDWGPLSRLLTPALGSLLSYGFLGEAVAPGQLSIAELEEAFNRWYPGACAP